MKIEGIAWARCALPTLRLHAYIDSIAEAEINPLIVKKEGEGVVAVDGLIVQR